MLAVGDEPFQQKCLGKIREFQEEGRSIVLVAHSSGTISEFCNQVAVLDHGNLMHVGDTESGLNVLSALYAQAAGEPMHIPGDAHIHNIAVASSRVNANGEVPLGADLTINIDYSATDIVQPATIVTNITSGAGQLAYQLSTKDLLVDVHNSTDHANLAITLPDQHLGGGEYFVSATMTDANESVVASVDRGTSFFVESAPFGIGTARFNATGSISPL
jgi:ABC-2 type transport system ATP-binding protein